MKSFTRSKLKSSLINFTENVKSRNQSLRSSAFVTKIGELIGLRKTASVSKVGVSTDEMEIFDQAAHADKVQAQLFTMGSLTGMEIEGLMDEQLKKNERLKQEIKQL